MYQKLLEEIVPKLDVGAKEAQRFWSALRPLQQIAEQSQKWIRECRQRAPKHIAFHVRRGDHKLFNHEQFLEENKLTTQEKWQLQTAWAEADTQIEVQHESSR